MFRFIVLALAIAAVSAAPGYSSVVGPTVVGTSPLLASRAYGYGGLASPYGLGLGYGYAAPYAAGLAAPYAAGYGSPIGLRAGYGYGLGAPLASAYGLGYGLGGALI